MLRRVIAVLSTRAPLHKRPAGSRLFEFSDFSRLCEARYRETGSEVTPACERSPRDASCRPRRMGSRHHVDNNSDNVAFEGGRGRGGRGRGRDGCGFQASALQHGKDCMSRSYTATAAIIAWYWSFCGVARVEGASRMRVRARTLAFLLLGHARSPAARPFRAPSFQRFEA